MANGMIKSLGRPRRRLNKAHDGLLQLVTAFYDCLTLHIKSAGASERRWVHILQCFGRRIGLTMGDTVAWWVSVTLSCRIHMNLRLFLITYH